MTLRSDLYDQQLVAVKKGSTPEALRREAALLEDLQHPGIIRFVALTGEEADLRLLTRYAGRETLATWQPQRLEELRRVAEELAEAARYLHDRGIVHRAIRPAHVVIDSLRRPQLCGFSAAGEPDGGTAGEQLADVVAIGETILAALARLEPSKPRSPQRRDEQRLRDRLRATAEAAAAGRVMGAKALAGQFGAAVAESRPTRHGGEPRPPEPTEVPGPSPKPAPPLLRNLPAHRRQLLGGHRPLGGRRLLGGRRPAVVAVVCAGCALGALMVVRLTGTDGPSTSLMPLEPSPAAATRPGNGVVEAPPGPLPPEQQPDQDPPAAVGETQDPPAAVGNTGVACRPVGDGARDVDGDGCAEEVRITDGFVSVDGVRYPVGAPGDQVAVGDWDCDGVATVALAQPGGQIYVFEGWPGTEPLVGTLVAALEPPVELNVTPRGDCHELGGHNAEGGWHLPLPGGG